MPKRALNSVEGLDLAWRSLLANGVEWELVEIDGHTYQVQWPQKQISDDNEASVPVLARHPRRMVLFHCLKSLLGDESQPCSEAALQEKLKPFVDAQQDDTDDGRKVGKLTSYFNKLKLSQELPGAEQQRTVPIWLAIEKAMIQLLAKQQGVAHDWSTVFESKRFKGTSAVLEFESFLMGKPPKKAARLKTQKPSPRKFVYQNFRYNKRRELFETVMDFALAPKLEQHVVPVFNVYHSGRWRDGTAFSETLEDKLNTTLKTQGHYRTKDGVAVLRIALSGYAQQAEPGKPVAPTRSFDDILLTLAKGVGVEETHCEIYKRSFDAARLVREIQLVLAKSPHVLIFDGYYDALDTSIWEEDSVGRDLLRTIRDDHFSSLILRLVDPPISETLKDCGENGATDDQFLDLKQYQRNRIVVVSNRPTDHFRREQKRAVLQVLEAEITKPSEAEIHQILDLCPLAYRDVFKDLMEAHDSEVRDNADETLFDAVDLYLRLDEGLSPARPAEATEAVWSLFEIMDKALAHEHSPMLAIVERILDRIAETSAFALQAILMLAQVPCGLKAHSLARICRRLRAMKSPDLDGSELAVLSDVEALEEFFETIEASTGGMIRATLNDGFPTYDKAPPIFETLALESDAPWLQDQSDLAFEFAEPMFKEAVIKLIATGRYYSGTHDFEIVHRSLFEEAISQQTHALRNFGSDHVPNVRAFRRIFSAVYHGLLSLPLKCSKFGVRVKKAPVMASCYFEGPENPRELYVWIYQFLFRRIVERPPAWNLARHYARDSLKRDILALFDQPWLLNPYYDVESGDHEAVSLIKAEFRSQPKIIEDFLINQGHAAMALNLSDEAARVIERIQSIPIRSVEESRRREAPAFQLRHLKDEFNISLLDETIDSETGWERLWSCLDELPSAGKSVRHLVEAQRDLAADWYFSLVQSGEASQRSPDTETFRECATKILACFDKVADPIDLAVNFADALYRISERVAIDADFLRARPYKDSLLKQKRRVGDQLAELEIRYAGDDDRIKDPLHLFCESLSIYKIAEALRMEVFRREPHGQRFFHSGHAGRSCIRTCLILERAARRKRISHLVGKEKPVGLLLGSFSREARWVSDKLSKHLFRYSRERASLMILEASVLRIMSQPLDYSSETPQDLELHRKALLEARRYLSDAETKIIGLDRSNRARMRLALERMKNSKAMACLAKDDAERKKFVDYTRYDMDSLGEKAELANLDTWFAIWAIQGIKTKESFRKLNIEW